MSLVIEPRAEGARREVVDACSDCGEIRPGGPLWMRALGQSREKMCRVLGPETTAPD
jgi:hypothetical protein